MKYPKLFFPFATGKVELRNRLVIALMSARLTHADGSVSEKFIDYFVERARGGVGMIIVGDCVSPRKVNEAVHEAAFVAGLYS